MTRARPREAVRSSRAGVPRHPALAMAGVLITIVLTSYAIRLAIDVPALTTGKVLKPTDFESRYVANHWIAYLHMSPGVLYLLGAPLQLSERFRTRHYTAHRRLGRVLVGAGLLSVVFAIAFGIPYAWGGASEAVATVVFGTWFGVCLALAVRAIRRGDVAVHRRWMIRAFVTAIAVGTIRIWIGLFLATGLLDLRGSFAAAFWIAFTIHVLVGEWWLRATPAKTG